MKKGNRVFTKKELTEHRSSMKGDIKTTSDQTFVGGQTFNDRLLFSFIGTDKVKLGQREGDFNYPGKQKSTFLIIISEYCIRRG